MFFFIFTKNKNKEEKKKLYARASMCTRVAMEERERTDKGKRTRMERPSQITNS